MSLALITFLWIVHTLGAALGAGSIAFAEVFYAKATADGKVDEREREYLRTTFFALRFGMTTVLLSGIVLILVEYAAPELPQGVLFTPIWFQNTLALAAIASGWGLSRSRIPWWLGSAAAFSAWWMMLVIDAWRTIPFNYFTLIILYVIFVFVTAGAFSYLRIFLESREHERKNAR